MKFIFSLVLVFTTSAISFPQDFLDSIAMETCECLSAIEDAPNATKMELGLCIINAAAPYKKQLKENYNIDFEKINIQGAELGQLIGIRMMSTCQDVLIAMANDEDDLSEDKVSELTTEGTITKVDAKQFVIFSLKDKQGKVAKFYWYTFIKSDMELSNEYKKLKNKSVRITFITKKFFDAKIRKYRIFNVITSIERLDK